MAKDFMVRSSSKYSKYPRTSDYTKEGVCVGEALNCDLCSFLTLAWLTLWRLKFRPHQFPCDFFSLGSKDSQEAHSLGQA